MAPRNGSPATLLAAQSDRTSKARLAAAISMVILIVGAIFWSRRTPSTDADASTALRKRVKENVNVVFVTLDTLRADRLPAYGFKGVETPNLDAFANEGLVFESVTTTVPLTLPAHSTLMTGRLPSAHGVRDNGGYFLGEGEETLAEKFKAAGYETGAFVAAWVLASKWGIGQGFDTYSDAFDLSKYKTISLGTVQ